jgi:hypothetical protein
MYIGYEVMFPLVTDRISILLNIGRILKFVNNVNTVHMVLSVRLD